MRTPWGESQVIETYAPGILRVHTAGHGGIKLDRSRNAKVPKYMRAKGGWYEEDCQWSIVGVVFASEMPERAETAKATLRDDYPEFYEKFFNEVIPPGKSRAKDQRIFLEENKNNWIVTSASRDEQDPETVIVFASVGGVRTTHEKMFRVSAKDYAMRGRFGYVIPKQYAGMIRL